MAADLQHTLSNLEITPPPAAWEGIEAQLDAEYDPEEAIISQKIYDYSVAPPMGAWEQISDTLYGATAPATLEIKKRNRAVIIPFRKLAIAASVIGITGAITWYLFVSSHSANKAILPTTAAVSNAIAPTNEVSNNLPPVTADTRVSKRPLPGMHVNH